MLVECIYLCSESIQCAPHLGSTLGELRRGKVIIFGKYNHLFRIGGICEVIIYKIKVVSEVIKEKGGGSFRVTNENLLVSNTHADFCFPKVAWNISYDI